MKAQVSFETTIEPHDLKLEATCHGQKAKVLSLGHCGLLLRARGLGWTLKDVLPTATPGFNNNLGVEVEEWGWGVEVEGLRLNPGLAS